MHPTLESDSVVSILMQSQTLQCASYQRVRLQGVHHTVESRKQMSQKTPRCASHVESVSVGVHHAAKYDSKVCIIPHSRVSNLPRICFYPKIYNCDISDLLKEINMKIITQVTNCSSNLFSVFFFAPIGC